jgi:quercetin dioxygenase-like cupin family protein
MKDSHVPSPDVIDPDVRRALDEGSGIVLPGDEELLARVKARVLTAIRSEGSAGSTTVRSGEGWERLAPGIDRKLLWQAGSVTSCMMRFAPGAQVPAHVHAEDEECVVLEGTVRIGELVLHPGDFHVGHKGSLHVLATTDTGAVVFLRGVADAPAHAPSVNEC